MSKIACRTFTVERVRVLKYAAGERGVTEARRART